MDSPAEKEDMPLGQTDTDHVTPSPEAIDAKSTGANAAHAVVTEAEPDKSTEQDFSVSHKPDQTPPIANAHPLTGQLDPEQGWEQAQAQPHSPQVNGLDVTPHISPLWK
jgi:hypothetical protein